MKKAFLKKSWKWIRIVVAVYIAAGVFLYFIQDKLLFHPVALAPDYKYNFQIPFHEILLSVDNEKKLSIIQFKTIDSPSRGVVLYFHGNRENITRYVPFVGNFTKHRYEVWMVDYPGFGKSNGERTENIMYEDAKRLYRIAIAKYSEDSIIIYGKSIGTGVASQLASVVPSKRLILETPYYSIDALAKHYFPVYPVSPMTKYSFPNYVYLRYIDVPITIFHGTRDEVIPYKQSKKLIKEKPGAELITIEKGKHNNLNDFPFFHQKLDSILRL